MGPYFFLEAGALSGGASSAEGLVSRAEAVGAVAPRLDRTHLGAKGVGSRKSSCADLCRS